MARYRKLPVEIDAVQFGLAEYADLPHSAWRAPVPLEWLDTALREERVTFVFAGEDYWYFVVLTEEGEMRGGPDDWLIRGVEGELYPCKDSVFQATYEPAA